IDGALAAPALVAIDGRAVGVVEPGEAGVTVSLAASGVLAGVNEALLASSPLPEPLVKPSASKLDAEPKKDDEAKPEAEVAWWRGLLPSTRLNLGLDLQGGIDLTLQVDQDAAVFAQVQRDRNVLRDQAARDNKAIEVLRDRSRPALKVWSDDDLATIKEWVGGVLRPYTYAETVTEDGKSFHVFLMSEARDEEIRLQAVEQVLETLRKRVDSTGVKEPAIVKMPGGRINIQLPGVSDSQAALDALGQQAQLEFRLVDHEADATNVREMIDDAKSQLSPEEFANDELLNEWLHEQHKIADDRALLWDYDEKEGGELVRARPIQLHDQVVLTGADVNNAGVSLDQSNQPQVMLEFKPQGARIFCDITTANVNKQFAIILDHQIRSAPVIRSAICGGSASIEMGGSSDPMKDANTLALVLRTGSLTAPVDVGEVRQVGPSLGEDAIRSGLIGSVLGGLVVLVFMILWYRTAGMVANVALVINVLLVFALLSMFGATLTLPGIAGIALTIGMAVDANIIVYERIREELALGVSARKAVDTGYEKGVTAVIDGNLTTAVAGVVLYSYGASSIKGFAVTLLIGIFTTIVTGVYVSRTLLEVITRKSNSRLDI
ncbi:MAG TPA: protein translocase subunit SecD, partial [Myxococcota bacterium]|nr:protein translocase subunit SecD [Myxococcota bacterium]